MASDRSGAGVALEQIPTVREGATVQLTVAVDAWGPDALDGLRGEAERVPAQFDACRDAARAARQA